LGIPTRDRSPFDDEPSYEELTEQLASSQLVIEQRDERIVELETELRSLHDRIGRLESELSRNSENSSKPPSSDPIAARQSRAERRAQARAARSKSGRPQGKQPGAPGAHLARRVASTTITHVPATCGNCGEDLDDAEVVDTIIRQVLDIPNIVLLVTDHVAERRRCHCGAETTGAFPLEARAPVCWGPGVRAFAVYLMDRQHIPLERTAELLSEMLGADVSTGWLCQVQQQAAGRLAPFVDTVTEQLQGSPVVHADETGTSVKTHKRWVHTVGTEMLTLLGVHEKRGLEAFGAMGVLPGFGGVVVHDGWGPYDALDDITHAQCHVHLVRHLRSVGETPAFSIWTAQMHRVLADAKSASQAAADSGLKKVRRKEANDIVRRYHDALDVAFALLPEGPPPRRRHIGGWSNEQRAAWNLATRMRAQALPVLRLLHDTRVPADNNTAERALRMVKVHDKVSGSFRSDDGARAFVTVRSYLQTAALHGQNRLAVLRQLFGEGPWLPEARAG
jgi:transposase